MLESHQVLFFFILLIFSVFFLLNLSNADLGTGAYYSPPYLRKFHGSTNFNFLLLLSNFFTCFLHLYAATACFGNDPNQFPAGNLFAAAGAGIWDNGAACGRQYLVRCLQGSIQDTVCSSSDTIKITIVDQATNLVSPPSKNGATMTFSVAAYGRIAKQSAADEINIEYRECVINYISEFLFETQQDCIFLAP